MSAAADPRRYYVIPPSGGNIVSVDRPELATRFAVEFGNGTHIVDTMASPYYPMVQRVEDGAPVYLEHGSWETGGGPGRNLIEAAKTGYPPIVQAFLAKGADPNAAAADGGTALMWAVAGGSADVVRLLVEAGADPDAGDADGLTPAALATRRNRPDLVALLHAAGAGEC